MQDYILDIQDRSITAESEDTTLVRTSIGADRIVLHFHDAEWLAFDLSCAMTVGETTVEEPLALTEVEGEWLAESYAMVPDSLLEHDGEMGVCVHGYDADGNHIITTLAEPLSIEIEGDAPAEEA